MSNNNQNDSKPTAANQAQKSGVVQPVDAFKKDAKPADANAKPAEAGAKPADAAKPAAKAS